MSWKSHGKVVELHYQVCVNPVACLTDVECHWQPPILKYLVPPPLLLLDALARL